ncbi:glycosyltransferase [Bacillus sp. FJAT-50079]|uniref:glycosyltransferase n=1 Tax=Bacillus sp. FJAT-50079 TaxID=2833577 RepID=UPI001BC9A8B8|nr:glycosyltransferase [Bacillus sp. FJAT-50079]MBS4209148.1 glycosyltransferase [Bacillus sp. FJAT-50079]
MKKSILFMLINMNVGGTEKALLNMLEEMPKDKFDITIFMLEEYGGFLNSIPSGVRVEYFKGYNNIKKMLNRPLQVTALDFLKKGNIIKALIIVILYFISKIKKERSLFYKYILWNYPVEKNQYDIAVAYAGPMDFISYFIMNKIQSEKKIQWIHFDITKIGFNRYFAMKIYKKFDQIFVVSKEGKTKLVNMLPKLGYRTEEFPNFVSKELVKKRAVEGVGFEDEFKGVRILTVGRLSKEKGQDMTIPVLAKLKKDGLNVRWYCVGDGSARNEYEQLIVSYKLQKDYFLLGARANPYPYMKQCDIYVQPSRHEGYCITLAEARCFDNPIISTNFTGAAEQIINEETGLLVSLDSDQMYDAIIRLLTDDNLRKRIKKNLQKENVNNVLETEKFNEIANIF